MSADASTSASTSTSQTKGPSLYDEVAKAVADAALWCAEDFDRSVYDAMREAAHDPDAVEDGGLVLQAALITGADNRDLSSAQHERVLEILRGEGFTVSPSSNGTCFYIQLPVAREEEAERKS